MTAGRFSPSSVHAPGEWLPVLFYHPSFLVYGLRHPRAADVRAEYWRRCRRSYSTYDGSPCRTRLGFGLYLNPVEQYQSCRLHYDRIHEPPVTHLIERVLRRGMTFLDLGANLGYFTILASQRVGDEGRVYAFEPGPENYRFLLKNIQLNGCRNVRPLNVAASNRTGPGELFLSSDSPTDHQLVDDPSAHRKAIRVNTITVDHAVGSASGPLVVKIDVQGHEMQCVQGMTTTLRHSAQASLIVEFCPYLLVRHGADPKDFLELLTSIGLSVREISYLHYPRRNNRWLLERYTYDNQGYTNLYLTRAGPPTHS